MTTTEKKLIRVDSLYWQGKPTGLTDAEYDRLAEQSGHICKPAQNAWASYPDYQLLHPNYGLKKIPYEVAKTAVRYWPKWDGIFIQMFNDANGWHCVTRGNGRQGKDLFSLFSRLEKEFNNELISYHVGESELVYPLELGGRVELCRDLVVDDVCFACAFIPHNEGAKDGAPPRDIPKEIDGYPIDGWVVELQDGLKYKYKG
jgi:hypothetical protein